MNSGWEFNTLTRRPRARGRHQVRAVHAGVQAVGGGLLQLYPVHYRLVMRVHGGVVASEGG
eukprot:COSAG02_NODE_30576_length_548_cov_1.708241_1_plen_61_part_00